MLFFRSEEDVNAWKRARNVATGEVLEPAQIWALSQKWYGNRLAHDFHGRTLEEAQEIFRGIGLTSAFWYIEK
ncbi:MAG: hypothetical protein IT331_16080 [Anaerolineae bacterium]|nr:hypothetical protein [Anaerolineae bacterium]